MANIKEISTAIKVLQKNGLSKDKIKLLHCSSEYPADTSVLNLKAISTLRKKFKLDIGYSDHSMSLISPSIAISLGAKIIEKHITLNNNLKGPDHKSSLNPDFKKWLKIYVKQKDLWEVSKIPTKEEIKNSKIVRKSIVAKNNNKR